MYSIKYILFIICLGKNQLKTTGFGPLWKLFKIPSFMPLISLSKVSAQFRQTSWLDVLLHRIKVKQGRVDECLEFIWSGFKGYFIEEKYILYFSYDFVSQIRSSSTRGLTITSPPLGGGGLKCPHPPLYNLSWLTHWVCISGYLVAHTFCSILQFLHFLISVRDLWESFFFFSWESYSDITNKVIYNRPVNERHAIVLTRTRTHQYLGMLMLYMQNFTWRVNNKPTLQLQQLCSVILLQIINLQLHVEFPFVEIHCDIITLLHSLKVNLFQIQVVFPRSYSYLPTPYRLIVLLIFLFYF